ncbi:MAG: lysophospholipase [Spirochaetota bacterium]|jgi:alpha-beta hydrolase superfamily lysophospholipase|nr:lysophospholipase [Spirochaetota bacterium]
MKQNEKYFESHDGAKLHLYTWSPNTQPKAVLHIAHGMAEHALRYKVLAEKLTAAGIEVWAADQRGHGKTADLSKNDAGKGGILGHCADSDTFALIVQDIRALVTEIQKTRKNIPVFVFGHSWGSFLTQKFIEDHSQSLDIRGCILSGTRGSGGLQVLAGIPFMTKLAFFLGARKTSVLAKNIADGSYNKPFKPNRTEFDWLSRDEKEVDKYIQDPFCGFLCSVGFYRDLAKGLFSIHRKKNIAKIKQTLPLYIFCGSADPVGEMGKSPAALVQAYRRHGIQDLEFVVYPDARHETLNETNRQEVMANLLAWMQKHI